MKGGFIFLSRLIGVILLAPVGLVVAEMQKEGIPPVFVREGNMISGYMAENDDKRFLGWSVFPEEPWECSLDDPEDCGTALFSVRAGLKSKTRASWYRAEIPVSALMRDSGAGTFRFGGWIQIDDGSDYYRDHLATIQLVSDQGFSKEIRSFCQNGMWSYFEERASVPPHAGSVFLRLTARSRVYKDAQVSFKGIFLVPDDAELPVWRDGEFPEHSGADWRHTDRSFRMVGEVSDSLDNQPLWVDFDFARLMLKAGCRKPIDPSSIKVLAVSKDGKAREVPAVFDHPLSNLEDHYLRNGTLKWRTVGGTEQYEIYFNAAGAEGPKPLCMDLPLGIGELLRYPEGMRSPLWAGWPGKKLSAQDVDGDGDLDLYAENTDAGIWLLRNIGSNAAPLFLPRQKPLPSDELPAMPLRNPKVDWNWDGKVDTVLYESKRLGAGGYIDGVSASLHVRLAGEKPVGMVDQNDSPVVFGNATWFSVSSGDFDGDGLPDLVAGSTDCDLHLLLNRGMEGGRFKVERIVIPWNIYADPDDSGDMSLKPCVVDWNGDGRDDLVVTGWGGYVNLLLNQNREGRADFGRPVQLEEVSGVANMGDSPTPEAVDWDGDGDLDLICGSVNGLFMWIENVGTATQLRLVAAEPLKDENDRPFRITAVEAGGTIQGPAEIWWGYTSCNVADVDRDGDLDLVINDSLGRLRWLENIGSRTAPSLAAKPRAFLVGGKPLITPWRNRPAIADWDGNGQEEVAVLDDRGLLVRYSFNPDDPDRLGRPVRFKDAKGGEAAVNREAITRSNSGRSQLDAADWDGDGDVDLLVGRPRNVGDGNLVYYENIGTAQEPVLRKGDFLARGKRFVEWSSGDGHDQWHSGGPCMADWNGDGLMDLLFGVELGRISYYRHVFFEGASFPVFEAQEFQTLETNGVKTVFRFGEGDVFSASLQPLDYPPQWLPEDVELPGKIREPRSIMIRSPKAGETLAGSVVFEVEATGGRALKKIEFFVDGKYLATEGQPPYVAFGDNSTWDTHQVKDGQHALSATAYFSDGESLSVEQTNRIENY